MPHASLDSRLPRRVLMHPPLPTLAATANESRGNTPTSRGSPSPSSPPSPKPLTPAKTFATSRNGSNTAPSLAPAEELALRLSLVEPTFGICNTDDDLLEHVEGPAYESGDRSEDTVSNFAPKRTVSEPLPSQLTDDSLPLGLSVSERAPRSSSMPSRPLRSALATGPPRSKSGGAPNGYGTKRARFDPNVLRKDYSEDESSTLSRLRPPRATTSSDDFVKKLVEHDLSTRGRTASEDLTASSRLQDEELTAAIGIFEDVVRELLQVADEHAETHDKPVDVAWEVPDLVFERAQATDESDEANTEEDADGSTVSDIESETEEIKPRRNSLADMDVDESCLDDCSTMFSEIDAEDVDKDARINGQLARQNPEVVFMRDDGITQKLDLETIIEERDSSTETVWALSSRASDGGHRHRRRGSDPEQRMSSSDEPTSIQRRASISDMRLPTEQLKLFPVRTKADPAAYAVTTCSVGAIELAKSSDVSGNTHGHFKQQKASMTSIKTSQTVRSDSGTFQVLWEEPHFNQNQFVKLLDGPTPHAGLPTPEDYKQFPLPPSPMEKVKTSLAVWSWAREQGLEAQDGRPKWMPLLDPDDESKYQISHMPRSGEPLAPPNTQRASEALTPEYSVPSSRALSGQCSAPPSPASNALVMINAGDDEDDYPPLEISSRSTCTQPIDINRLNTPDHMHTPFPQSRSIAPSRRNSHSALPRQLSNLATEETHFKSHRNSLDLLQHRRRSESKINQNLMNARDSIILARSKLDGGFPPAALDMRPAWSWSDALLAIPDASPPDLRRQDGVRAMAREMER